MYPWTDGVIDPNVDPTGKVTLTCRNHPALRWRTKNIGWIGARSIFFDGNPFDGSECDCPASDLLLVPAAARESAED